MKPLRFLAQALLLAGAILSTQAQGTIVFVTNTVIGQWDFDTAQLQTATVGQPLQFIGFTPTATTSPINGRSAGVMSLPATTAAERILATFAPTNNGAGTNLNQYTIIMDVMWPAESEGTWRALFNTDTSNTNDAEIFVNPDGSTGIFNNYAGNMLSDTWYRVTLVFDLTTNSLTRYLNGVNAAGTNAGAMSLGAEGNVDGRFSLNRSLLFFSDNDGETAPGFVNVIQLRAGAMTDAEVAALGGPGSNGLGEGGEPVGDVEILTIRRVDNNVVLTFSPGRQVQLQRSASLGNPNWVNEGVPVMNTATVPITGNIGFFRVQVL
jgi:hypothetical protein